ncbi:MAG: hypothetical protein JNJ58_00330 [Chitinophagaceae bacterium]|nr:hypothetical protein [Chitinophagaceae bacterium]
MIRRIFYIILWSVLIFVSGALYFGAVNETFFNQLESSGLVQDVYTYGDLYGHTALRSFKEVMAKDSIVEKFKPTMYCKNQALYLIGDSYTMPGRMDAENFAVDFYQYGFDARNSYPDTTKQCILIIEKTERYFREWVRSELKKDTRKKSAYIHSIENFFTHNPNKDIFNTTKINERIEYLSCNNSIALFLKEMKASMLYYLFGYSGDEVYVSERHHMVYLRETVDSTSIRSPYHMLQNEEADRLILFLNHEYLRYKSLGFSEVYFSLIPEKARVYQPFSNIKTNRLFDILKSPNLNMPVIDILPELTNPGEKVFHTADTHWNTTGINCWLRKVNEILIRECNKR